MAIEVRISRGKTVFTDWEVKEYIGSGSGGKTAVFRIVRQHEGWEETSALKVINVLEEIGKKEELSESYRREYEAECKELCEQAKEELRLMSCLQGNPNIVEYYDFLFVEYQEENVFGVDLLIRMELLENLREEQKRKGEYSEQEIIRIGRDICKGLKFCHRMGIIHRDIKPANIFVTSWGTYKLGDFGIARMVEAGQKASTKMGTRAYAAPEQFMSHQEKYDERVDIYSLGITLYELANGNRLPFAVSAYVRESEIQLRIMGKEFMDPCNVSPLVAKVIKKACINDAEKRYASAEEFESALVAAEIGMLTIQELPEDMQEEQEGEFESKEFSLMIAEEEQDEKKPLWMKVLGIVGAIVIVLEVIVLIVVLIWSLTKKEPSDGMNPVEDPIVVTPVKPEIPDVPEVPDVSEVSEADVIPELSMKMLASSEEYREIFGEVKYITTTNRNVAVINEENQLYMWGENECGQIGCGDREYQALPVLVMDDVASVTLSETHTAAITTKGDLYLWGRNLNLEIGNGGGDYQHIPIKVLSDVKEVSLGDTHSGALCNNGDLYGWGNPNGNGIGVDKQFPTLIASGVKTFSMNNYDGGAVTEDGDLYMWGGNWSGQVGNGPEEQLTPVKIMDNVKDICVGEMTAAAIKENGELYVWGTNTYGQVGNGSYTNIEYEPSLVLNNVKSVVLEEERTAAITESGELYMWGRNQGGQLGTDEELMYASPYKVSDNVKSVVLGQRVSAMIKENGDLYLCGDNSSNQITESDGWSVKEFMKVAEGITSVGLGWDATYAVSEDGTMHYRGQ